MSLASLPLEDDADVLPPGPPVTSFVVDDRYRILTSETALPAVRSGVEDGRRWMASATYRGYEDLHTGTLSDSGAITVSLTTGSGTEVKTFAGPGYEDAADEWLASRSAGPRGLFILLRGSWD